MSNDIGNRVSILDIESFIKQRGFGELTLANITTKGEDTGITIVNLGDLSFSLNSKDVRAFIVSDLGLGEQAFDSVQIVSIEEGSAAYEALTTVEEVRVSNPQFGEPPYQPPVDLSHPSPLVDGAVVLTVDDLLPSAHILEAAVFNYYADTAWNPTIEGNDVAPMGFVPVLQNFTVLQEVTGFSIGAESFRLDEDPVEGVDGSERESLSSISLGGLPSFIENFEGLVEVTGFMITAAGMGSLDGGLYGTKGYKVNFLDQMVGNLRALYIARAQSRLARSVEPLMGRNALLSTLRAKAIIASHARVLQAIKSGNVRGVIPDSKVTQRLSQAFALITPNNIARVATLVGGLGAILMIPAMLRSDGKGQLKAAEVLEEDDVARRRISGAGHADDSHGGGGRHNPNSDQE